MTPITFRHGPVTITVDGLPDTIAPESVNVELALFYHGPASTLDARRDRFAADFADLGGRTLFPDANPNRRFSVAHVSNHKRGTSKLQMFPPIHDRVERQGSVTAITLALGQASTTTGDTR